VQQQMVSIKTAWFIEIAQSAQDLPVIKGTKEEMATVHSRNVKVVMFRRSRSRSRR
jgi:hypothetical protein